MIGTVHSVPRLMPGQGFIIGVGTIAYPAEYEGADPQTIARLAVSKVFTLTSTYDHRIIGGAESGEFLRWMHQLLLGDDDFYDEIFQSFGVPYEPARWSTDVSPLDDETTAFEKVVHVHQLVNMYRVRGHLIANLDPLGRREPRTHPELDVNHYGLTIWDLDREFPVGGLGSGSLERKTLPLRDILGMLRDAYARTIGVEYMHIQEPEQKEWIQARVETPHTPLKSEQQRRILDRLNAAEAFEGFLHTKYLGQKRFSLEGAESLIPMLDALLSAAADAGMAEAVLGTAHRGRLNVLVNTIGKSYGQIFREFEGALDPASVQGSGDVKYHVGAAGTHTAAVRPQDRGDARVEPEPPRGRRPGGRGHGPRQGRPARRHRVPLPGAPGARARRRRVRRPGRRRGDVQPLRGPGLRGRRHRARRGEQPARVHHRAGSRSLERVRDRRRQDGAGADLPRER